VHGLQGWLLHIFADRAAKLRFGAAVNSVRNPTFDPGLEARFARAARHSRMVRVLRVAVPTAVFLAMASVVGISIFNPFRILMPALPVDMDNLVVSGSKITMEAPHLSGYTTPDRRPYDLWAKTATQDLTDPDRVELTTLHSKVLMEDQTTTVTLDARTGIFDNKLQTLNLHKDIFLQTSSGYEARLSQAFVDMGKGTVTSEERVDVKLTNGTLSADRLRITEGGAVIRFEGNVVMNIDHMDTDEASAPSANASATASASPGDSAKTRSPSSKSTNLK
jgi:lipopolysaccharide export system protein LptC